MKVVVIGCVSLAAAGCVMPYEEFVQSERETYNVVAPVLRKHVSNTPMDEYTPAEQAVWEAFLNSWDDTILEAEKSVEE